MSDTSKIYWLHALTPVHVGVGFGAGAIDLPIFREKFTGWPPVPGSAVKGVLSDRHSGKPNHTVAFGQGGDDNANSGALVFSDARLVCLPVQSLYGTFAWATSALALRRLKRDLELTGAKGTPDIPAVPGGKAAAGAALKDSAGKVFFSDLDFEAMTGAEKWAAWIACALFSADSGWQGEFIKRFAIVPDEDFDFLSATACEVTARVRIDDEKKTVAKGALWYEEALPAESILAGIAWCDGIRMKTAAAQAILRDYCKGEETLQIGGKATVGRGRTRVIFGS